MMYTGRIICQGTSEYEQHVNDFPIARTLNALHRSDVRVKSKLFADAFATNLRAHINASSHSRCRYLKRSSNLHVFSRLIVSYR
jgi:hypothetical protein